MKTITLAQLKELGACEYQLLWFEEFFGAEVTVTEEVCLKYCSEFDFGWAANHLLSATAMAEYERVRATALAECARVRAPAWEEYKSVRDAALAECVRVRAPAWAEYKSVRDAPALAEYERVRATALDEYRRVRATAWAEYKRVRATAWDEYVRMSAITFCRLFNGD